MFRTHAILNGLEKVYAIEWLEKLVVVGLEYNVIPKNLDFYSLGEWEILLSNRQLSGSGSLFRRQRCMMLKH